MKKEMIKRKDGSYSQRGLWDNIRANRGSGKKPTAQMLKQERKIKSNMQIGGMAPSMPMQGQMEMPQPNSLMAMMSKGGVNNPGFKKLPGYVQAKIRANMQYGGSLQGPMDAVSAVMAKQNTPNMPMMQVGGMMPQSAAGKSVLQEAMMMSQMQNGGKMPTDIARARFMAAANGNTMAAKSKASQYGYKLQGGGGPLRFSNAPSQTPGQPGFNFQQASAAKTTPAKKAVAPKNDLMAKYQKQAVANSQEAAAAKKANRNIAQKIGDDFPTYLNVSGKRNVVTDLADMATMGASKLGMTGAASQLQTAKQNVQDLGQSNIAKTVDFFNPVSIAANVVGGAVGTVGDLKANEYGNAASRFGKTTALAATRGLASNVAGAGVQKAVGSFTGKTAQHQLQHAGQHALLTPLLAHKNGGTIKDMYMMKKGGQFPERYKKMGFSGVDKPKRTSSGGKSHAVVTKVDGNYKLIRFGQKGVSGSPDGSARNKAFKARHAKNIAKGKSSAAYWANKIKWILFIPLMLWQAL
jgi:hypothetical protein